MSPLLRFSPAPRTAIKEEGRLHTVISSTITSRGSQKMTAWPRAHFKQSWGQERKWNQMLTTREALCACFLHTLFPPRMLIGPQAERWSFQEEGSFCFQCSIALCMVTARGHSVWSLCVAQCMVTARGTARGHSVCHSTWSQCVVTVSGQNAWSQHMVTARGPTSTGPGDTAGGMGPGQRPVWETPAVGAVGGELGVRARRAGHWEP